MMIENPRSEMSLMELSKIYLGICKDDDEIRSHSSHIGVSGHEYF